MNGSVEIMEGDLVQHYGSTDSNTLAYRNTNVPNLSYRSSNPHATRFASVQGTCNQAAVQLNWVAIQQFTSDRYDIEQSSDSHNWTVVGTVPANRTGFGQVGYNFNFTRNASNVMFRIVAVNTTGERMYSSVIESPCSNESYLGATPNPVYSTTTVRIGSPATSKVKLSLLNSSGLIMQVRDVTLVAGTNQVPLDMSGMTPGYYTVYIQWNGGRRDVINLVKR
jgi:hypothetical protein